MEIEDDGLFLKKIKLRQLEPALRQEIVELASELGYETTIRANSNLHFLFKLYQAEKAKDKKSKKALKKAEKLILTLRLPTHSKEMRAREAKQKREKKPKFKLLEGGRMPLSKKTRDLLESIGITDEKDMEIVVGLLGEKKVEERVELIKISELGDKLTKEIFGTHTEVLIIADDDAFTSLLEAMEGKKSIIESWRTANGVDPPVSADYDRAPAVLLEEYRFIANMLELKMLTRRVDSSVAKEEKKLPKYIGKPMDPDDFKSVMLSMGFVVVREAKHGTILRKGDAIMAVQKAHKSQMQLNASTIKKKLTETGVDLGEFQKARDDLGL